MIKEYSLSGVKYWKDNFSDLKPNDILSAKEFKERYSELNDALEKDRVYSSFNYFKRSKIESELLEKFEGNLRYVVLPFKLIDEVLTDWDTGLTYGVSWKQARTILESNTEKEVPNPYDRSSGLTKLTNRAMLGTFKKFGLARPLINVRENPFWDERFTHRMKFTSYTKSDIPFFIREEANIFKGKGLYTEKNTILDIEILENKYNFLVGNKKIGYCKL